MDSRCKTYEELHRFNDGKRRAGEVFEKEKRRRNPRKWGGRRPRLPVRQPKVVKKRRRLGRAISDIKFYPGVPRA